ncbi:sodium/proline symporter PutP [Sporosalibacterium faouarense]|uniref:sodium/proline symporter PutP n=1 Tax=Sporosalibacterium faouarense TaxID=516123 RepID=UPI00192ABB4D|nr:sodium/proline symporter PutP [Sporosalibacterium faouarense]
MISFSIEVLIVFIVYLLFMLLIGVFFYKRNDNLPDYILGGRGLNSWVTAMSAQASDMSGWLLLGLPGYAYASGMESIWIAIGLGLGTYLNWKFIAKRLRKYTQISGDSITLSVYFENRFRDKSKILRTVSAFFIILFFLFYTSSGLVAGGKLFNVVFGMNYTVALTLGALVIIAYTFFGGFMAVSWTDFFQGLLMFITIIIVPAVAITNVGGLGSTLDSLRSINVELLNPFTGTDGNQLTFISIFSLFAWFFGYFGQPHILARFMAIKSSSMIKKARNIAMIWVVISLSMAILVGITGRVFLDIDLVDPEYVFMAMVSTIFPAIIAGIMLAAILAAIMSTADSQLLVSASALTEDFYRVFFKRNASEKQLVWVSRMAVIGVAIVAYILALNAEESVLELVSYAWGGFGAAFGPVVIFSLFWKRMTRLSAIAGMITGGLTVVIWKQLTGGIFDIYEIAPGFILASIVIVGVSLLGKKPSEEILNEFEKVRSSEI